VCYKRPWFTGSLHVLLYFPQSNLSDPAFSVELKELLSGGRGPKLLSTRITAINELFGPDGSLDPVLKHELNAGEINATAESITRRHFANALKQYHDLEINTINKLIANTSPAYIPSGIELACLKPLFEKFPMVKVLAHPAAGSFPGPGVYSEVLPPIETVLRLLPEFLELGLNGLEVFYPGHTPELIDRLIKIANDNELLISGGSDFHDSKARPMGTAGVTEEELEKLLEKIGSNQ
jgi:3',5'-nucleoside bisphosphate phosphatase